MPTTDTYKAFADTFRKGVTGAHDCGVRSYLAICSHSGNAIEKALNDHLGADGVVTAGQPGKGRTVKWAGIDGDTTTLALPNTHISMDAYHLTDQSRAWANCDTAADMYKVPLVAYSFPVFQ